MLVVIPFSGFYCSVHDEALDFALEQYFQDERGDAYEGLVSRAFDIIKWQQVHEAYARLYAENFASEFLIPSMKFESLQSPKFYNFETDRIFCEVELADMRRVLSRIAMADFVEKAKEMFTSRSGFHSFYSPDIDDWGDPETWDHNQWLCVLNTLVGDDFDGFRQFDLMDSDRGNGEFDRILGEAMQGTAGDRLHRVYDYLRRREERSYTHA